MCIAIMNPSKTTLSKEVLQNCWENNTDGAGMLYIESGQLKTFKEMKNFDNFYEKYLSIKKNKKSKKNKVVLHFRISTHGKINEENCHPFLVNESLGFVHNGIIYDVVTTENHSDTFIFNETYLQSFPPDFLDSWQMCDMIEKFIGNSKLVFLDDQNNDTILNEEMGVWDMDCWFSNTTYKTSKWMDVGGQKVLKSSQFTPTVWNNNKPAGYSYNNYDYGRKWDGYNDSWYEKTQDKKEDVFEETKNAKDEMYECDCCSEETKELKYSKNYNTFLCETCKKQFDDDDMDDWESKWDSKTFEKFEDSPF